MQIVKTGRFLEELELILDFIATDNPQNAISFLNQLNDAVYSLSKMPYRCRQSQKSTNETVRDLIFKGYITPYRVNKDKNRIEIIGIFNANEWNL